MALDDLAGALEPVIEARERGIGAVVVSVVSSALPGVARSSQRMVVLEDGSATGSIGPLLDERLVEDALSSLHEKESRLRSYTLDAGAPAPAPLQRGCLDVYFEVLHRPQRLIIVGGGHIAVPLSTVAAVLGFHVTVLDDRPEFASRERFPQADEVLLGPYPETLSGVQIDHDTYIVLVTRGHVHDQACLELVLDSAAAYIGMIGSKRRVRTVMEHVAANGVVSAKLSRVYAPVGLDIGARTPAEIAVAIAAELVNVRRNGKGVSLALGTRLRV